MNSIVQSLVQSPSHKRYIRASKIVENTIKNSDTYLTQSQLETKLKGKVTSSGIRSALKKLVRANKIMYDKDNTIVWIYMDSQERKLKKYFVKLE